MSPGQEQLFRQIMDRCKICPTCGEELHVPITGGFRKVCSKRHGEFTIDETKGLQYIMMFG